MFALYRHVPLEGPGEGRFWAGQPPPRRAQARGPRALRDGPLTFRTQPAKRVEPPAWLLDSCVTNQAGGLPTARIRARLAQPCPRRGASIQMLMGLSGLSASMKGAGLGRLTAIVAAAGRFQKGRGLLPKASAGSVEKVAAPPRQAPRGRASDLPHPPSSSVTGVDTDRTAGQRLPASVVSVPAHAGTCRRPFRLTTDGRDFPLLKGEKVPKACS